MTGNCDPPPVHRLGHGGCCERADVLTPPRRDWQRHLRNLNRAANTQRIYDTLARQFCEWLLEHERPTDPRVIGKREIEDFMDYMIATRSASTANVAYRALKQWWKWMLAEEEIDRPPMERTSPPFVPDKTVPVPSIDQMRALLDSCKGRELTALCDTAIIRLLIDSGGRLGEVAGLAVEDLDFEMDVAHAVGKGRRPRALPFGDKTGAALARYLRTRARERQPTAPSCGWPKRTRDHSWPVASSRCSNAAERPWTHRSPACTHTCSPHRRPSLDGRRRIGNRPHANHGLALTADAAPLGASAADERARAAHRRLGLDELI